MTESYLIPRRTFLRGVGASLGLPWLDIMSPAVGASPRDARPPIRLGVLYKGNGVHPPSWDITGTGETRFELSPLLQPLAAQRDDVLFLSNLDHQKGGWSHHSAAVAFLAATGAVGKSLDRRQPLTIDQLIAARIGDRTPLSSLEMTSDGIFLPEPVTSYISYDGRGRAVPRESDPQIIFDRMFRGIGAGRNQARNLSVLDAVLSESRSLRRRASQADLSRLDAYFEAVRGVEKQLRESSDADRQRRQPAGEGDIRRPSVAADFPARVQSLLDMMVLAFWTDTTRVITFLMANSSSRIVFDFLGINEEHHYLSHFVRNSGTRYITHFNRITQWHLEQYAYLIRRLAAIPEADGRLLDNTVLMFGSGMKHGDYHSGRDLPVVLAGGKNAGIKTGRWLKYPEPQPWGNLLLSLAKAVGVDADGFGSSSGRLTGLDRSMNYDLGIHDDGSWVAKEEGPLLHVTGLLRPTNDLEETNVYFVRLSDGNDVVIDASFGNLNSRRVDHHVGRVATLSGPFKRQGDRWIVTNVDKITARAR